MRSCFVVFLSLFMLVSCKSGSDAGHDDQDEPPTVMANESIVNTPSPVPTSANLPLPEPTVGLASISEREKNAVAYENDGYQANLVVGIDQFGRSFGPASHYRPEKKVGMFFWLWIGQPFASGIYDATIIAAMENGNKILFDPSLPEPDISPSGQAHFWGEPIWGYYNSIDEWVIRRQLEMITLAEIDFIYFDTTNAITYRDVYIRILRVIDELQQEGWNPPRVVFYTHSRSLDTIRKLYGELYSRNIFPNTWYMENGKPLIIGYTNTEDDIREALSRSDTSYAPEPLSDEILDFFTFRKAQWPSDPFYPDGFPWVEWTFPPPVHTDVMNVSVASHPSVPMSFSLTRGLINWGRGWNPDTRQNVSEDVILGTFFQRQWDHAIVTDPDLISVGGWNEWIAYKQIWDGEYMLCDAANMEYSRDIEPMKGGYEDAFYLQLVRNVRAYKGVTAKMTATPKQSIDISGDIAQWDRVETIYRDVGNTARSRNEFSATSSLRYTIDAPRNNILYIKTAHDDEQLYFQVACENIITPHNGESNWMNLLIGTGEPSAQGWEGYNYIINRSPNENGETTIEALGIGFEVSYVGSAGYYLDGNVLNISINKSTLNITGETNMVYFKITDGIENVNDIMDTYISGEALPMGRLSYAFILNDFIVQ